MLNELRDKVYINAKNHGFYDNEKVNIPEKLMLIVSELGEAMEAYRNEHYSDISTFERHIDKKQIERYKKIKYLNDKDDGFDIMFESYIKDGMQDEIADTIIRLLDLCGYMNIDIDKHIELKMKYNESRPYKHGKKC